MYNRGVEGVSSQAMQQLLEYPWPGNVRELENVIERAVILEKGKMLTPRGLSLDKRQRGSISGAAGHYKSLGELEKGHIETVLKATKGNRTKAARILGIGRRTLYDKIVAYGITEQDEE